MPQESTGGVPRAPGGYLEMRRPLGQAREEDGVGGVGPQLPGGTRSEGVNSRKAPGGGGEHGGGAEERISHG